MSCALDSMSPEKIVDAIENKEFVWKKEYNENLVKRFEIAREFLYGGDIKDGVHRPKLYRSIIYLPYGDIIYYYETGWFRGKEADYYNDRKPIKIEGRAGLVYRLEGV